MIKQSRSSKEQKESISRIDNIEARLEKLNDSSKNISNKTTRDEEALDKIKRMIASESYDGNNLYTNKVNTDEQLKIHQGKEEEKERREALRAEFMYEYENEIREYEWASMVEGKLVSILDPLMQQSKNAEGGDQDFEVKTLDCKRTRCLIELSHTEKSDIARYNSEIAKMIISSELRCAFGALPVDQETNIQEWLIECQRN